MRRRVEALSFWIVLVLLVGGMALLGEWWIAVVAVVAAFGFAIARPLDRRANNKMPKD